MSRGWHGGSTRAWRKLRAAVLERDGHRCQVPVGLGLCLEPAKTVGHLDELHRGGQKLAPMARLRAECAHHNYSAGAKAGHERQARSWSW